MAQRRVRSGTKESADDPPASPKAFLTKFPDGDPETFKGKHESSTSTAPASPKKNNSSGNGNGNGNSNSGNSSAQNSHLFKYGPEASPITKRAEVNRLRSTTGIADLLPPKPNAQAVRIPPMELPAHAVRDSMLHHQSGFDNYRGLYNLALLGLVIVACQISIVNILKYGILVNPRQWVSFLLDDDDWATLNDPLRWPCTYLILFMQVNIFAAFVIEKLASKGWLPSPLANFLHIVNVLSELGVPTIAILRLHPHPALSFFTMFTVSVAFMKLVSYTHVNIYYRHKQQAAAKLDKSKDFYPNNLGIWDLYYFFIVPTLCYELEFPRNTRIRKTFLLRRALECILFTTLLISLGQQWVQPTVLNTFQKKQGDDEPPLIYLIQRTLKLALPNGFLWLCGFYVFFHSYLNFVGELFRFGDRQFYRDWWNATTLTYFWQNWNIPVHKWAVRHLYRPLITTGWSKLTSNIVVFLFSAIFHELLVSVPLGMFKYWAFAGMLAQVPLAIITEKYFKGSQYGNVIVWASLMLGQPLAIMLYVNAYFAKIEVDANTLQ